MHHTASWAAEYITTGVQSNKSIGPNHDDVVAVQESRTVHRLNLVIFSTSLILGMDQTGLRRVNQTVRIY